MLKHLTFVPIFSDKFFGLKPHVFDRILLWRIWCELHTGYRPFLARFPHIHTFKVVSHLFSTMVRGPIPADDDPFSFKLLTQQFNKYHRPAAISTITPNDNSITSHRINCTIIALTLTSAGDRKLDPFAPWPPYIPTCILPNQVAFIEIQDDYLSFGNRCFVRLHEFADLFFFAATNSGLCRGLTLCAFLCDIFAS